MPSEIEWTGETWNPLAGCTPVSPGCLECYAGRMSHRLACMGQAKYVGLTVKRGRRHVFNGKLSYDRKALKKPLSWRKGKMIFVNSMSDLFHEDAEIPFILEVFEVMARCPQHTFQVLTKRPKRANYCLSYQDGEMRCESAEHHRLICTMPLPNVWLGTSVESQKYADERVPELLRCPTVVPFLSVEPLLGRVSLQASWLSQIRWVIVGCESLNGKSLGRLGGTAEEWLDWARHLRDQCLGAGVPFFVKQIPRAGRACGDLQEFPDDLQIRQFPKGAGCVQELTTASTSPR